MDTERALERGRNAYAGAEWRDALAALGRAHGERPLAPDDLELLARSAYMLGLDDEYRKALEQAYQAYHDVGDISRAQVCVVDRPRELLGDAIARGLPEPAASRA